jgi:hypothetical protein
VHQNGPTSTDLSFDLRLDATVLTPSTGATGGVPLHPGVNRVTVQAFDGANGTGKVVDTGFVDVWYTGTANGTFAMPVDDLEMIVPDTYRPGTPFVVQVRALNDGKVHACIS